MLSVITNSFVTQYRNSASFGNDCQGSRAYAFRESADLAFTNPSKGIDMATYESRRLESKWTCLVRRLEIASNAVALTLLSLPAYADDPISRLLFKAVDLLTNQWAIASAVVTIAAIGYR